GATLRSSIIDVLRAGPHRHEFVIFQQVEDANTSPPKNSQAVAWARNRIRINPRLAPIARAVKRSIDQLREAGRGPTYEEICVRDADLDIIWFLSPYAKPVVAPYITTVWDLEHRKQPFFPE